MTDDVYLTEPLVGLVEDDDTLRATVARGLESAGMRPIAVGSAREAMERFPPLAPAALILDIGLPDADGRDLSQALRAAGVTAPVIFLTARSTVADRLSGFGVGADDYLTKPFALAELLARVMVLIRRAEVASASDPGAAPGAAGTELQLDPAAMQARVGTASCDLTPTEFRLLAALVGSAGTVVRRRALIATAWPDGAIVHDNTLDTYLKRLRGHLRSLEAPVTIRTVRGIGYELR